MRNIGSILCLGLAIATLVAPGCARRGRQCCVRSCGLQERYLETVPRGTLVVDVNAVGSPADVDRSLGVTGRDPGLYRGLSPEQCQCFAVEHSPIGNLLADQRRSICAEAQTKRRGPSRADCMKVSVLEAAEAEARNTSAATAMELFYHLAAAEARTDLVLDSMGTMGAALRHVDQLRQQGVQLRPEVGALGREKNALDSSRAQLDHGRTQLTSQLGEMLGLAPGGPIFPAADFTVQVEPIDVEEAVSIGLSLRPDLDLLRTVRANLDRETLDAARAALVRIDGLLGLQAEPANLLCSHGLRAALAKRQAANAEVEERRRQLDEYIPQREREAAEEIRRAAAEVEHRLRLIALAKQLDEQWGRQVAEVQARTQTSDAKFFDVTRARLSHLQARGELVAAVSAWRIAQVELKKAQGLLVTECPW